MTGRALYFEPDLQLRVTPTDDAVDVRLFRRPVSAVGADEFASTPAGFRVPLNRVAELSLTLLEVAGPIIEAQGKETGCLPDQLAMYRNRPKFWGDWKADAVPAYRHRRYARAPAGGAWRRAGRHHVRHHAPAHRGRTHRPGAPARSGRPQEPDRPLLPAEPHRMTHLPAVPRRTTPQ